MSSSEKQAEESENSFSYFWYSSACFPIYGQSTITTRICHTSIAPAI